MTSPSGNPDPVNAPKVSIVNTILCRAPLMMLSVIFTMIGIRYLSDTVGAGAAAGINFTSPGGITVARVGFAGLPLALAILGFASLFSERWRLAGIYMVLTVDSVIIMVRIFSMFLEHSTSSARLLIPEVVLLVLSITAVRLESVKRSSLSALIESRFGATSRTRPNGVVMFAARMKSWKLILCERIRCSES